VHGNQIMTRATVVQRKTQRPVQFELTEQTRNAVTAWIDKANLKSEQYLFPSRSRLSPHVSTRQYARIVHRWVSSIGLDPSAYGTHTMRRTKATLIYRRTKNLRAVQLLLNSLRNSGARPGDVVAILGVGGLGHLGVQFAAEMGFRTVAIARGRDKEPLARKLGAQHYIDSQAQDAAAELIKLGGARVILATATSSKAMSAVLSGLGVNGKLMVIGAAAEPLEVPPLLLIMGRRAIVGWPSGTSIDSQDTLSFSALTGVRAMNEVFPLERVTEAYELMMSGKARFRVVLRLA
jgi:hypothetical protein